VTSSCGVAECGCIRVSVLLMGERSRPGHHESRRRGANHWRGFESQKCYRLIRAGGRSAEHEGMRAPLKVWLEFAAVVSLEAPGGPDDAREFVGKGDGGLVVTAALLKIERPSAKPIK
jgi:hypothetical protein